MRDTERKRAIIDMLEEHGEWIYQEILPPPWNAATIASQIGGSTQSVARTLRTMAQAGKVVAVKTRLPVWNAIAGNAVDMPVTAYYSARTMERDIEIARAWHADSKARSDAASQEIARKLVSR
ncbi:hypothetical protein [Burkholderia gladioli]|uniref:hypothetical protein n=1 Tax=Burkholderia gladioli TaxID=28095 RepID=UPI0016408250|nr:hypothetical protein [Burkholderia gladioli]